MHKVILSTAIMLVTQAFISTQSFAGDDYLARRTAEINKQAVAAPSNTCHTVWWHFKRSTFPAAFASFDGLDGDAPRTKPTICWAASSNVESNAEQTALFGCNRIARRRHLHSCVLVGSHP